MKENNVKNRIQCAWHVLMGRPLAYRVQASNIVGFTPDTLVVECKLTGTINV